MLVTRQSQINEILELQRRQFSHDTLPVLRQEFPELWVRYTDQEIEQLLCDQCDRSAIYNVKSAVGIYTLLTMRLRLSWGFPEGDEYAWAREILARDLIMESERIAALEAVLWGNEES